MPYEDKIYKGGATIKKRISVIKETNTGRNQTFKDNYTGDIISRSQFVNKIKSGDYPNHHVRKINGTDTPVSNPNGNKNDNLG